MRNSFEFFSEFFDKIKGTCFSFGRVVSSIVDIGPPADWVKINVRETVSLFGHYALFPPPNLR